MRIKNLHLIKRNDMMATFWLGKIAAPHIKKLGYIGTGQRSIVI